MSGSTGIGGSSCLRSSPHVTEKSTPISKKNSEIEPCPSMCHGAGPSMVPCRWTEKRPTPNTLTESDAERSITKEERIERKVALHVQAAHTEKDVCPGSELGGVGGNGVVALHADPRGSRIDQDRRYPPGRRDRQ